MRLTTKRQLLAISSHSRHSSPPSSSSGAFGEPSDGGTSSYTGSYSYASEGLSPYYSTSSVLTSSPSAATTTAVATVSFSTVDSSPTNGLLDVLTPLSAYSHPSTPPSRAVNRSADSISVASHHGEGVSAALGWRAADAATTINSSSVPADDTGTRTRTRTHRPPSVASSPLSPAAAAAGRSPTPPAAPAPFTNRSAAATTLNPSCFSEEGLVRHSCDPVDIDATTCSTGEGGGRGGLGLSVLDTIRTVPVVSPPPEEAQRRREDGRLSYPSHITYRIMSIPSPVHRSDGAVGKDKDRRGKGTWGGKGGPTSATAARERKTSFTFCGFFRRCREKAQRNTDDRAAMRQRPPYPLRSHHVPLVSFRTTRAPGVSTEDVRNVLPSAEETPGYRSLRDDIVGTAVRPERLERANLLLNRSPGGLRPNTSDAFGPQADGGPGGNGRLIFVRGSESQGYWVAHLHELASVRLEPIVIE